MLILSRKVGQGVQIGEEVEITVLEVRGDTIRLGIQAPRTVAVHRKEVCQMIAEANRQATAVDVEAMRRAAQLCPPGTAAPALPGVHLSPRRPAA